MSAVLRRAAVAPIVAYQRWVSPALPRRCKYEPTCSAYALEAFQKRGFFVGMFLSVRRVLRCNPFHPGGYDPVPEKGLIYRGSNEIPIPDDCRPDSGAPRKNGAESENVSDREADGKPDGASVQGKEKNQ